jgi:preprotein translocase YajC subunit
MTPTPALIQAILAASSSSKSTTSPLVTLLPLLAIGVLGYFFFIRPQQRKAQAARQQQGSGIEVGDEVQTVGGVIGTVLEIHGDRYTLLTGALGDDGNLDGPQPTRIVFVRQAIAKKIEPIEDIRVADQPVVDVDDEVDGEDDEVDGDVHDVRTSDAGERGSDNGAGNRRRNKGRSQSGDFDDNGTDADEGPDVGDAGTPKKRSQGAEEA